MRSGWSLHQTQGSHCNTDLERSVRSQRANQGWLALLGQREQGALYEALVEPLGSGRIF